MDFGLRIEVPIRNPQYKIQNEHVSHRIAAVAALVAFAVCLIAGGFAAQNGFATVVTRALVAMSATFVVGLIVGAMAQKMLDENLKPHEEKSEVPPDAANKTESTGR